MGIFDDFNKSRQEEKERNERIKKEQAEKAAKMKAKINDVLLNQRLGKPLYFFNGFDSKLWIYPDVVIIDRTEGKVLNAFNHTIKAIPMKQIRTLQFKNSGVTGGFIEFGVSGNDASRKENFDMDNENRFNYSPENLPNIIDAYFYLLAMIKQ